MDQQLLDDAIDQVSTGKTAFPSTLSETRVDGITYIAAGNNDVVSTADLGGTDYDTQQHSTVEAVYEKDRQHRNSVVGLKIHNPDNSQLQIDLHTYNSTGVSATRDARDALLLTYEREASTDYGTSILTQNAQYYKEMSWVTLKNTETMNDSSKLEASLIAGQLSGSFLRKSPEAQSEIFYQQHEMAQEAVNRALQDVWHAKPDDKLTSLQDLLNAHIPTEQHHTILKQILERQEALPQATEEPINR